MKEWKGSLITGSSGQTFLRKMSNGAKVQSVQRSIEATGLSFVRYSPWMSHARKRNEWSLLHVDTVGIVFPQDERLQLLARAFNENGPLRAIDPSNIDREVNHDHPSEIDRFRDRLGIYVSQIQALGLDYSGRLSDLVQEVIPLRKIRPDIPVRFDGEGMTTQCYRGGIFLTLAHESDHHHCEDVLNFIHECGHQAFNLILCSDQIVNGDINSPAYSPVRKTMRPGILAVHALVAVVYMMELMTRAPRLFLDHSEAKWVSRRFFGLLDDFEFGLASMKALPLTPIGKHLADEFESVKNLARRECHVYKSG